MRRTALSFVTALAMSACMAAAVPSAFAEDNIVSGNCGGVNGTDDNVTWSLNRGTGVMTISGNGSMPTPSSDYFTYGWVPYGSDIKEVIFTEGVTNVGDRMFGYEYESKKKADYSNLEKVTLSSTVTRIGDYAFAYTGITDISFPENLESIGQMAFGYTKLREVTVPAGITLRGTAFAYCDSLKKVTVMPNITYHKNGEGNMSRANKAFGWCANLETVIFPDGAVPSEEMFSAFKSNTDNTYDVYIFGKNLDASLFSVATDVTGGTFDGNPIFHIYKGSTTEASLTETGYLSENKQNKVYLPQTDRLSAAIADAENIEQGDYSEESYADLKTAIENGKTALPDYTLTQEQIDKACEDILTAKANLKNRPANYEAVDAAIASVPTDLSVYTEESVAKLNAALDAVDRSKDYTEQETVDGYANAINKAIDGLELLPDPTTGTEPTTDIESTTDIEPTTADQPTQADTTAETEPTSSTDVTTEATTASQATAKPTTATATSSTAAVASTIKTVADKTASTSSDKAVNTGAGTAAGITIFMATASIGAIAVKKKRK